MSAPVKHTCPDIDKMIKRAKEGLKSLEWALKLEYLDDIKSAIRDAINEVEDIEGMAEDLRSSNDSLREWGKDCEKTIDELEAKIWDFENEVN